MFQTNYLSISQNGASPIVYPHRYVAPSNTGTPTGFDLGNSGSVGGPNDAFGFGFFPGQYGMAVYSMYPIDYDGIRTFQLFLWKDMPGGLLPDNPSTGAPADWSAFDTTDFSDTAPGNLRADYVLPRRNIKIMGSGVFWPLSTDPLFSFVGTFPFPSSHHRLVWIDVRVK